MEASEAFDDAASEGLQEGSPLASAFKKFSWDKAVMGGAVSTGDPVTMAITKLVQDAGTRKDIEAETGRDFSNNQQGFRDAQAYKAGGATASSSWEAVQDDLADVSSMFPPESEL
jgi:hypothetical protein|tara:strand:+ start:175 stop:519 length:345 start_codon:yes stop_codon:yes gene_type:complete